MNQTPTVLMLSGRYRSKQSRTHAPDCKWVAGTNLHYRTVAVKDVPADQPRCRHCGGGR